MLSTDREDKGMHHTVKIKYTDYGSCRFHAKVQDFRYKPPAAELSWLVKEERRPNVFDLICRCKERVVEKDCNPGNWRRYVLELTNEDRKRHRRTCEAPQCNEMLNFRVQHFLQSRHVCHPKAVRSRRKESFKRQHALLRWCLRSTHDYRPPSSEGRSKDG